MLIRTLPIFSDDATNSTLNRINRRPDLQQVAKIYPGEAAVTLNGESRKAMADQSMTASRQRLKNRLGILSRADIAAVENAVLLQLGIRR